MKVKSKYDLRSSTLRIHPSDDSNLWNCEWIIHLRNDDDRIIGKASFIGDKEYGTLPLNIELEERFRNQKYGTEAIKIMTDWAFLHKNVYELKAVCEHENDKAIHALEKARFVYRGINDNLETYTITKPKTTWMGLYIFIGIFVGLVLGIVLGNQWVGLAIGLIIGMLFGANMDSKANKDREKIVGKKLNR